MLSGMGLGPDQGIAAPGLDGFTKGHQRVIRNPPGNLPVGVAQDEAAAGPGLGQGRFDLPLRLRGAPIHHGQAVQIADDTKASPAGGLDLGQVLIATHAHTQGPGGGEVIQHTEAAA